MPLWVTALWLNGTADEAVGRLGGGWHWAALAYAVWEQWFGVLFGLGLALLARDGWNHAGPRLARVNAHSFGIYVTHAPVLIALTPWLEATPGGALARPTPGRGDLVRLSGPVRAGSAPSARSPRHSLTASARSDLPQSLGNGRVGLPGEPGCSDCER